MSNSNAQREQLKVRILDIAPQNVEFFLNQNHSTDIIRQLENIFSTPARYSTYYSLSRMEEYETRLEYARQIRERMITARPEWIMRQRDLSIILFTPLDHLRDCVRSIDMTHCESLFSVTRRLILHGLQKPDDKDKQSTTTTGLSTTSKRPGCATDGSSSKRQDQGVKGKGIADLPAQVKTPRTDDDQKNPSETSRQKTGKESHRLQSIKRKALNYAKGVCPITGSRVVQVCHVLPFAWTSNTANTEKSKDLVVGSGHMFEPARRAETVQALLASEVGGLDKIWNLIVMKSTLHDMWGKGYFALKFGGYKEGQKFTGKNGKEETVCEVSLIFIWKTHARGNAADAVDLNANPPPLQGVFAAKTNMASPPASDEYRAKDGLLIGSGWTFSIFLATREDVDKFKIVIDLQWALIDMLSMAGGGQKPDDWLDPDDKDLHGGANVLSWLMDPTQPDPPEEQ